MNQTPIIEVKGLGKRYDIRHQQGGYIALRDVLMNVVKHPLSFIKQKARSVTGKEKKDIFWALKDAQFTVNKGETIGIIGSNGAGKSTLLKILTGITPPTEGEIIMRGRVASLLEVGTGFHPELTGRENIFLNGAILGMTKSEIVKNFDKIVEFAGIQRFLDTPVKHYSSGMYVRLAFSVAAHMDPDILFVDEVLAVGDSEFQKKCLGKMEEVTSVGGRTILFVSHNMAAIQRICKKVILLEKGRVKMFDETQKVIDYYLRSGDRIEATTTFTLSQKNDVSITKVSIFDDEKNLTTKLPVHEPFTIEVEYTIKNELTDVMLSTIFFTNGEPLLFSTAGDKDGELKSYKPGTYLTSIKIPAFTFNIGSYFFDCLFHRPNIQNLDHKQQLYFEIINSDNPRSAIMGNNILGKIAIPLVYKTKKK